MPVPALLPTAARDETFAGVTYHIEGELVPVLHVEVKSANVYFEHHILLWKDPSIEIGIKSMQGAFKRILAGMPIFMTETQGHGRIAFSRDGVGHVFAIHLKAGEELDVREHQFLAATASVDYTFSRVKGIGNILFGGTGFFIDTFSAGNREGILWLHGYGNVFEVTLKPGEQIDIEVSEAHGRPIRRHGADRVEPVHRTGAHRPPIDVPAHAYRGVAWHRQRGFEQARQESNLQPPVLETGALPIELRT